MKTITTFKNILTGVETGRKTVGYKLFLSLVGAYITAISAQIVIPLPHTPVPITGQIFAIMLIAGLLGPVYGGLSQLIYVTLGAIGLPWYAGGIAGLRYSITAGYLIGFIWAVIVTGYLIHYHKWFRESILKLTLAMSAGLIFIYSFGISHILIATQTTLTEGIKIGILPFIIPDTIKIITSAIIVKSISRK